MKKKLLGFTLIELMVTVVIMMVIAAAGMATYAQAQIRARNTERLGDMKAVQSAFEQYFAVNSNYAANCLTMAAAVGYDLPTPASSTYLYNSNCTTTSYCYCAQMEGNVGNTNDNSCATNFTSSGSYFCVESQQ